MVHGHVTILVDYAAKRSVVNALMREYREEALESRGQIIAMHKSLLIQQQIARDQDTKIEAMSKAMDVVEDQLERTENKLVKARPWATVGKTFVVVGSIAVVGIVAAQVIGAAR